MKRCTKCGLSKPLDDFPANKLTKDGRGSWCKSCVAAYYRTDRGKQALTRGLKKLQDAGYFRFGRGAIPILRQGAKARGLTFTLTADSLDTWWQQTPDHCAYCGISTEEFRRLRDAVVAYAGPDHEIRKFKRTFRSPKHAAINWLTLDRVDNSRGYEVDNLVKCCWFCNTIKGSLLTHVDMFAIAKGIIQRLQARIAATNQDPQHSG
jgi:hypothetical protein